MADDASSNKRSRDEYYSNEPLEAKRLRADRLLEILDGDDDDTCAGARDPAVQDLASVMRSLEEEIAFPPLDQAVSEDLDGMQHHELGYLLEASDDELGLPPTVQSSSDDGLEAEAEFAGAVEDSDVGAGFGQIWGFEDAVPEFFEGINYGIRSEAGGEESGVHEGGVLPYTDSLFEPSDFYDSSWLPETMPAA